MASVRLNFHRRKISVMLILAWYALLISIGIAIIQGMRK